MNKEYLGDAVYVEIDQFDCIVLTTSNGITDTNRIVFEPEVLTAFKHYLIRRDL